MALTKRGGRSATLLSVGFFCLIGQCGCSNHGPTLTGNEHAPTPIVETTVLSPVNWTPSITATGAIGPLPGAEVTIKPLVSGTLVSLSAEPGQTVSQGEMLAKISSASTDQQVIQAQTQLEQTQVQLQQAEANALEQQTQTTANIAQAEANVRSGEAALDADNAILAGDSAALTNAQQKATRAQTLFDEGLLAQKDVEDAQLQLASAQSQLITQQKQINGQVQSIEALRQLVLAAKAGEIENQIKRKDVLLAEHQVQNGASALASAKAQESLYTIVSPISGTITAAGAAAGESVDTGTELLTIAKLDRLLLTIGVPVESAQNIHPGLRIDFTIDAYPKLSFKCIVSRVAQQVDDATGAVFVYANLDNSSGLLKDGMLARASIQERQENSVLAAPATAVLTDADTGLKSVAVIDSQNILHIAPVQTATLSDGNVQILGGVAPGSRIATAGAYGVPDGTKVDVRSDSSQNDSDGP